MENRPFKTFSIYARPKSKALMAVVALRAFGDDSGTDNDPNVPVVGVGTVLGTIDQWSDFEERWQFALDHWKIPYLHMKEFGEPFGIYQRFHDDQELKWSMLATFVGVIRDSGLFPVSHIVVKKHLTEFNRDMGLKLNSYSLALYGCLMEMSIHTGGEKIELVVDRFKKQDQLLRMAERYCRTDKYYQKELAWTQKAQINQLGDEESFKEVLPIQAADFVAWELRRATVDMVEFVTDVKSGDDGREWSRQHMEWSMQKYGHWPHARRSLITFGVQAPVESAIWDRRMLDIIHKARDGLW